MELFYNKISVCFIGSNSHTLMVCLRCFGGFVYFDMNPVCDTKECLAYRLYITRFIYTSVNKQKSFFYWLWTIWTSRKNFTVTLRSIHWRTLSGTLKLWNATNFKLLFLTTSMFLSYPRRKLKLFRTSLIYPPTILVNINNKRYNLRINKAGKLSTKICIQ